MRAVVAVCVMLALAWGAAAQDKKDETIDAKKLVGKWESVGDDKQPKVTVEYTADGKVTGKIEFEKMELVVTGTYKVDGNKLTQTIRSAGKEEKEREQTVVITITKLTDAELTGEWDSGKQSFTRVGKK